MVTKDKNRIAFRKMKRAGMYVPPLSVYDDAKKLLKYYFNSILLDIARLAKRAATENNVSIAHDGQVKDSLLSFALSLKGLLFDINPVYDKLKNQLRGLLSKTQKSFFKQFYRDADENIGIFLTTASLKKDDVFHDRITDLRELYINDAVDRIKGEIDELKKQFLEELTDWIEGRSDELNVDMLIKGMKKTAVSESKFFARDQFLKFNKSLLIASLKQAGVTHVKWQTVGDHAVRDTHRKLNGQLFSIDNIPKEFWDYNCRCTLIPIWDD